MTNVMYKYPILDLDDEHVHATFPEVVIQMPKHACVLHVATQAGIVNLWALVFPDAPIERRKFLILGTGQEIDVDSTHGEILQYIGTAHQGRFVWHVFEKGMAAE